MIVEIHIGTGSELERIVCQDPSISPSPHLPIYRAKGVVLCAPSVAAIGEMVQSQFQSRTMPWLRDTWKVANGKHSASSLLCSDMVGAA